MTLSRWPALNVKVMEIQISADPAVLWLRARQLCYLGGHAPQCEIIGMLLNLKVGMPADLADSLKADDEDRKTDHAPLVVTENEEVATLTATIETNLQQGDVETSPFRRPGVVRVGEAPEEQSRGTRHRPRHRESRDRGGRPAWRSRRDGEIFCGWQGVVGAGRGAPEEQSRRTQEQIVAGRATAWVDVHSEEAVAGLRKRKHTHGWAVFCSFDQSDVASS